MMSFDIMYFEIRDFLSMNEKQFDLKYVIDNNFKSEEQIKILEKILIFIRYFTIFKDNNAFMKSVYNCIVKTLEIKMESLNDFNELLIKNTLMRFVQEYLDYAQIGQKDQVLNLLTSSFEKLGIQPLIINLGLLLKPMYSDDVHIDKMAKIEEVEVVYALNDKIALEIKKEIDIWLNQQALNLEQQDALQDKLLEELNRIIKVYKLSQNSESYKMLKIEAIEMFSMKLTMLSLMESIDNGSCEPVPL